MEYIHAPRACIRASCLSPSCNYIRYRINIYCCLLIFNLFALLLLLCKLPFQFFFALYHFPVGFFFILTCEKWHFLLFSTNEKKNASSLASTTLDGICTMASIDIIFARSTERLLPACAFVASDWRRLLCELWTQWPDFMQLCKPIKAS